MSKKEGHYILDRVKQRRRGKDCIDDAEVGGGRKGAIDLTATWVRNETVAGISAACIVVS
jgi:hypothetical protein